MGIIDLGKRVSRNVWRLPVVGQVLERDYARSFAKRPPNQFRGVYPTFAEAEASIPAGNRVGYDHAELAGLYRHRMEKANQSDYAVLFWLKDILDERSFVFDFGGHVGVSYHGWRNYLRYRPGMRWLVHDVPAIVKVGAELARERPSEGLAFTSDVADARGCSIFLAAGALQYVDESLPALLARIGGPLPRHLIVNKMPLYDGETFVTVQSTGRAFHPYRIYNRAAFVAEITALGYRAVDDWVNREQHCEIPFTEGRDIDAYSGYYFVREA
ncbi:MAG TPA: methyltransferase, TIGR04325 family [Candidatus Limnocylindrales bacterium]|jgi:putative methyltransferase (TIGR04325 family)